MAYSKDTRKMVLEYLSKGHTEKETQEALGERQRYTAPNAGYKHVRYDARNSQAKIT